MGNSFVREYGAAVWKKWWWLIVTGGLLTAVGAVLFILGRTVRVPAFVSVVVGLAGISVAQVLVARDLWRERNAAAWSATTLTPNGIERSRTWKP